jgi:hypothetical protein
MKAHLKPILAILASLLIIVLSLAALSTGSARASNVVPSASGNLPGEVDGYAYGGYLKVPAGSSVATVGPLFPASLGCNLTNKTASATAASMQLGTFASTGTVTDTVTSTHTPTDADVHANSTIQSANILASVITADAVTADAFSHGTATAAKSHGGATFVNLVVLGVPISATPAPNTTITLPGLGFVVLNEQKGPINNVNHTHIYVNAIDVNVTLSNTLGLPVGTHIIIAHADSNFTRTTVLAVVSAKAYGLFGVAKVGPAFVKSGPWALATIGCTGGHVAVSVTSVTLAGVGSTGTITDKAFGQITSLGPNANSSSNVQSVTLLGGAITADAVTTTAQAAFKNSKGSASTTTTLLNAQVLGITLSANPAPNTKIKLAGLGYVIVNEQKTTITSTSAKATVNAFDIVVTMSNSFGLPIGTHIIVAHSDASVTTA